MEEIETWYVLITRHFDEGKKEKTLFMTNVCAKEFGSKNEAQEFIDSWLSPKSHQLAPGESAAPSYEPVTADMFGSI